MPGALAARRGSSAKRRSTSLLTSNYIAGVVHTQHSLDAFGNGPAVAAGKAILAAATDVENQHIMGFGPTSPEPTDGNRDYEASGLDDRLTVVMAGANTKVITFGMAPAWMREVPSGVTPVDDFSPQDWFHAPPAADKVDDFADLCADIAATYTDVQHFFVWNELKGMFLDAEDRWDYQRYTTLYNAVWTAVKAVRPDALIGGPYPVLGSGGPGSPVQSPTWGWVDGRIIDAVLYWLEHKTGADFMVVDGTNAHKDGLVASEFGKFASFMSWLRSLNNTTYPGAATLPVWIAEHYCYPPGLSLTANSTDKARYPAAWALGQFEAIKAGYGPCLLWGPEGNSGDSDAIGLPLCLFTSTLDVGGGQPTAMVDVFETLHDNYQTGATIYAPNTGNSNIKALGNTTHVTLVNRTTSSQSTSGMVGVASQQTLGANEVKTVAWTPVGYVPETIPDPGPLWVDDFATTDNLRPRLSNATAVSGKLRPSATSSVSAMSHGGTYPVGDQYAEVVISTLSGTSEVGCLLRFEGNSLQFYVFCLTSGGSAIIYYFDGGSYNVAASASVTIGTLPGTLRAEAEGTSLRLYWRGSLATSVTDANIPLGEPCTYLWSSSSTAHAELDSIEADLL